MLVIIIIRCYSGEKFCGGFVVGVSCGRGLLTLTAVLT